MLFYRLPKLFILAVKQFIYLNYLFAKLYIYIY